MTGKLRNIALSTREINRTEIDSTITFHLMLEECCEKRPLTRAEEAEELWYMACGEPSAREMLIMTNQRFVLGVAKYYKGRGVPLEDLVMAGNVGLCRAVDRFNAESGNRLISYAVWDIRAAIQKEIVGQSTPVRVAANTFCYWSKYRDAVEKIMRRSSEKPSMEDIAKESGLPMVYVIACSVMSASEMRLDKPMAHGAQGGAEDGATHTDIMPSKTNIHDEIDSNNNRELVDRILDDLDPRRADVMRRRFGLQGAKPQNLAEIAAVKGLSRERVRQIQEEALFKIRNTKQFGYVREAGL